ncbi:hypothetical protein, partial [Burkholderia territorii]|uniref:hypothetical protein n=1 Tax=Burkholderia territorii TaxID=1503055 RepID=UPI000A5D21CA
AGALVGGGTGALTGAAVDRFNRQLHPEEKKWISEKVAVYAKKYGLTVEQAHNELTTQANLQVQNGSPGSWNQRAYDFLKQAHGMLPADGNSGPGYMFYATPEQKADIGMYSQYYPNGAGMNAPGGQTIANSVNREQANRNQMGGATIAVATGGALIVGAPIAATVGSVGFATIGATTGGGMDAAGQYAQSGSFRPAQSGFAAATGALTGPIGTNAGFIGNVLLGGAGGITNAIFNNSYYGESNSPLYAGAIGSLSGVGGYLAGLAATQGFAHIARPVIYPNLDPKIPALLQGVRNPLPGFAGATAGSVVQGVSFFVPNKER